MLLRFRVENHASLLDEQELSLVAEGESGDAWTLEVPGSRERALTVAAVFGANASGKSNLVRALGYLRSAVLDSHRIWQPDGGTGRLPFLLGGAGRERPSVFAVDIVVGGVRYEYGFSLDDQRILEEWLFSYPFSKRRKLYVRDADGVLSYGDTFSGQRKVIADTVRPNSLYLSAGASNNHPVLGELHSWFHRTLSIATDANYSQRFGHTVQLWEGERRQQIEDLLRYADLGVETFEVSDGGLPDDVVDRVVQARRILDPDGVDEEDFVTSMKARRNVRLAHRAGDGLVALSAAQESSGTHTWVGLLGPVVDALSRGAVLVVDELDARLHSLLAARLVALFQSRKTNPKGAQLIFNTHDATLLAPASQARLRRDQVWLTEKHHTDDAGRTPGATELISLIEYRPRDGVENLEKRYLAGRYGALPFFDDELVERFATEGNPAR